MYIRVLSCRALAEKGFALGFSVMLELFMEHQQSLRIVSK